MADARGSSAFEKDFAAVADTFPKLRSEKSSKGWRVTGSLDICDIDGNYWGTFDLLIRVPLSYPYGVPLLYETSTVIDRNIDHHISEQGLCCVDITHQLMYRARFGISIGYYLREWVYPFFSNQLYRLKEGRYAGGEYAHHFDGVVQFYKDNLRLEPEAAVRILEKLLTKQPVGRNEPCPCGSAKKTKACHQPAIDFMKTVGADTISKDLDQFKILLSQTS